ncbi:MAG TPA: hypothetical protein VMF56_09520 [Acidobacteriaceae bacterium]|nr:hypothetical protein [Acidobacteriaceae bacterium]
MDRPDTANTAVRMQLHGLLETSGAYTLVQKLWSGKGQVIRYEFVDIEDFYACMHSATYAPTIVVSTHILRNGLASDNFLRIFLLHELGHIDHVCRAYFSQAPKIENTDIDAAEAEADNFVVACGQKDALIDLLEKLEDIRIGQGLDETVNIRRLRRLRALDSE